MNHIFGRIAVWPSGRRAKWVVLAAWVVLLAVAVPLAGKLAGAQKNDNSAWLPRGAESTRVIHLETRFQPANTLPAIVVYQRLTGITRADQARAAAARQRISSVPGVTGPVTGPVPARDGRALALVANIRVGSSGWQGVEHAVSRIRAMTRTGSAGISVLVTGAAGYAADQQDVFGGSDRKLLYITAAVVILILLLTYRSPVLWLLPLLSAFAALEGSQAVIYLLARYAGLVVNGQSSFILTVLVFGAGTDYALLLVARYREELRRHADRHQAMAVAIRRAGPAILASAATVIIAMSCLAAAQLNSTKGLGPVCAIGVAVGLAAMTTLLPALLVITGRWVFWPVRPVSGSAHPAVTGVWARAGQAVARRPRLVWTVTALALAALAIGVTGLKASGVPGRDSLWNNPQAAAGEKIFDRHFPAGAGSPVIVISRASAAPQVRAALAGVKGITTVARPVSKDGYALVQGTLAAAPDSKAAYRTVADARARLHVIRGAGAVVGGASATSMDVQNASRHDRALIIPLVLAVVFVILALLLRSLIAPLLLVATVVLSFAATLGVSALVFNHLFHFAGADAGYPLLVFVFLIALGIDYNIFLVTRVREESARHGTRTGALTGLAATGGVITSAGIVLAGTFAALGTIPLVLATEIGFAVAFGVLLDTIVVRSVLVTALTLDTGRWMWWPSRLSRQEEPSARRDITEPGGERAFAR